MRAKRVRFVNVAWGGRGAASSTGRRHENSARCVNLVNFAYVGRGQAASAEPPLTRSR